MLILPSRKHSVIGLQITRLTFEKANKFKASTTPVAMWGFIRKAFTLKSSPVIIVGRSHPRLNQLSRWSQWSTRKKKGQKAFLSARRRRLVNGIMTLRYVGLLAVHFLLFEESLEIFHFSNREPSQSNSFLVSVFYFWHAPFLAIF